MLAAALAAALASWAPLARAQWPEPPERSGSRLPPPREVSALLDAKGIYVPRVTGLAEADTAAFEGVLTWNFAFEERIGLFGLHGLGGMWWGDDAIRTWSNEAGVRFVATPCLTLELAYMNHQIDRVWIGDFESSPGGLRDHGGEISTWLRFEPHSRIRLELRLVGRVFDVYRDTQGVLGLGLRGAILLADGHSLVIELDALRVTRSRPRTGVERVTWNVLGAAYWRASLSGSLGLRVGARLSSHLLVGEVPMLELKRSMIDEPMLLFSLGLFFRV